MHIVTPYVDSKPPCLSVHHPFSKHIQARNSLTVTGKSATFKDGVALDLLDERKGHTKNNLTRYAVKCVEDVSPSDDNRLIIVPTNSYQIKDALEALVPRSGDANYLIFSANWEGVEFIDQLLPWKCYLMGYPDGGGTKRNGTYWTNLGAEVHLGEVDGNPTEKLEQVKALFARADLQPDIPENILHWLWLHNAMSIGIWAGFAKYCDVKEFLRDRSLPVQCYYATKELIELCLLRGVDLKKYPETTTFRLPTWLFIILFRWLYTHNESMQRFTAHAADILKKAQENYLKLLKTADELRFEMPNLRALVIYLETSA